MLGFKCPFHSTICPPSCSYIWMFELQNDVCAKFDARNCFYIHLPKVEHFSMLTLNLSLWGVPTSMICEITISLEPIESHYIYNFYMCDVETWSLHCTNTSDSFLNVIWGDYTLKIPGFKFHPVWVNIASTQYWVNFTRWLIVNNKRWHVILKWVE